jgi:uncharacterized iron-regulated protein
MVLRSVFPAVLASILTGCSLGQGDDWQSPLGRSHPLAGRIWDVRSARFLEAPTLLAHLSRVGLVLLGEKHDNADHHRLQAKVIEGLVEAGRRPAVALEMLSVDLEPALARVRAQSPVTLEELRQAVRWDESGWPEWDMYAPVFEAALRADLSIVAADLSRSSLDSMRRYGLNGIDSALFERLALDEPLSDVQRRALADQIRRAHCGHAHGHITDRMVDMQRARDAHLARQLIDASHRPGADGAVLIAGTGHVRRDFGAPIHLARWVPESEIVSVAFLEVVEDEVAPAESLGDDDGAAPFDYLWYTPRVDDVDPCEKFKERLRKLGQ